MLVLLNVREKQICWWWVVTSWGGWNWTTIYPNVNNKIFRLATYKTLLSLLCPFVSLISECFRRDILCFSCKRQIKFVSIFFWHIIQWRNIFMVTVLNKNYSGILVKINHLGMFWTDIMLNKNGPTSRDLHHLGMWRCTWSHVRLTAQEHVRIESWLLKLSLTAFVTHAANSRGSYQPPRLYKHDSVSCSKYNSFTHFRKKFTSFI